MLSAASQTVAAESIPSLTGLSRQNHTRQGRSPTTYQNPEGGLYLKREEKDALGGSGGAFEVDLLQDYDVRSVTDQLVEDINAISGQEP